jgi:release factor glutamine methyltransferase
VHLACGDLLDPQPGQFDLICANLPYVAPGTELPAEVTAQPSGALYADRDGAAVVLRLVEAAPARLNPGGRLLVEVSPEITGAVTEALGRAFSNQETHRDLGGHERVIEAWS